MFTLFGLLLFGLLGERLLKAYEQNLADRKGPWIMSEVRVTSTRRDGRYPG